MTTNECDHDPRTAQLAENLNSVRHRIAELARDAGRDPRDIELLPVSKFHPAEDVQRLAALGVSAVGENREQEARDKAEFLSVHKTALAIDMIGQIQSKKCAAIARWAHRVHTVDRLKLVNKLDRGVAQAVDEGERESRRLSVFVQWSADGDPQRGGATTDQLDELADAIAQSEHLHLLGLMVVPPLDSDAQTIFTQAAMLSGRLQSQHGAAGELSAGMTSDLPAAIAAGSTLVRVGTAIMGPRPIT